MPKLPAATPVWLGKLDTDLRGWTPTSGDGRATATRWYRPRPDLNWIESQRPDEMEQTVYALPFLGEDETIKAGNWVLIGMVDGLPCVLGTTGEVLTECMP